MPGCKTFLSSEEFRITYIVTSNKSRPEPAPIFTGRPENLAKPGFEPAIAANWASMGSRGFQAMGSTLCSGNIA